MGAIVSRGLCLAQLRARGELNGQGILYQLQDVRCHSVLVCMQKHEGAGSRLSRYFIVLSASASSHMLQKLR